MAKDWQARDRKRFKQYKIKEQKRFYNEPKPMKLKHIKVDIRERRKEIAQEHDVNIELDDE